MIKRRNEMFITIKLDRNELTALRRLAHPRPTTQANWPRSSGEEGYEHGPIAIEPGLMKPNTIACRVPIGWQFITIEVEGSQINVGWESDWGSDYTISPGVSIELAAPNSPALDDVLANGTRSKNRILVDHARRIITRVVLSLDMRSTQCLPMQC